MKKLLFMILTLAIAMSLQSFGAPSEPGVKEYQFSSFGKPNPRVKHSLIPTAHNSRSMRKVKGAGEQDATTVPVKIHFLHDTKTIVPNVLLAVNDEEELSFYLDLDNNGLSTVDIPEGEYDFYVLMSEKRYINESDPTQGYVRLGTYFYLIDDVVVSADTPEITVDAGECHAIRPDFHLANGDELQPDLVDLSDFDNPQILIPGNIAYSSFSLRPFNIVREIGRTEYLFYGLIEDYDNLHTSGLDYHTIYVNGSSDNWVFFGNWRYVNSDYSEVYSFTSVLKPSDTEVSFASADHVLLPWDFVRSKTYTDNEQNRIQCSSIDLLYRNVNKKYPSGGSTLSLEAENPKVYIADKSSDFVTSGYILTDVESTNDWGMNCGIGSCEMTIIDGELHYLQTQRGNLGAILMGGAYDESLGTTSTHEVYTNGHKRFSSDGENTNPVFGKTAPILRVVNDICDNSQDSYSNRINPTAVGQYGEIRESDVECGNLTTKFTFNGEVVEENYVGNPIMFCMDWNSAGHEKGVMEYEMLTENIFEDGIEGYNRTYIYTDQTKEDPTAPTITHLTCRNNEDRLTNRFGTPDNGVVEFSASDFSSEEYRFPQGWKATWFESHPIHEVKAEWSPYGQGEWTDFDVMELPEYFEEGFGHFYRGSLEGVNKKSINGWYDLRITLCDATGNMQQQTISPVFMIESMADVNQMKGSDADSPEEYYNLQGIRIDKATPGEIVIKRVGKYVSKLVMK